jgi:predicted amidophosphoribosyltransferase
MKTIICKGCLSDLPVKGDVVVCPCCGTKNDAVAEEEDEE